MIEVILLFILAFLGLPLLAILVFAVWSLNAMELNRPPTKEEWKQGKRRKVDL